MRISIRSASEAIDCSAIAAMAISGVLIAALAGVALGQAFAQRPPTAPTPPAREDARKRIERQAPSAINRVSGAIARAKRTGEKSDPALPPPASAAQKRRAFDAMRWRKPAPAIERRVTEALARSEAEQAVAREAMAKRLAQALGLEPPDVANLAKATATSGASAWVPVLFVSSSMPVATLRTYAVQLERAKGVLAFRGMPGGLHKVGPMARLAAEILRIDPGCEGPACAMRDVQLIVDPLIYRQHGVVRVPALAMIEGDPTRAWCERDDNSPVAPHIVYGDAALSGLLEEYRRLGGQEEVRDAQTRLDRR